MPRLLKGGGKAGCGSRGRMCEGDSGRGGLGRPSQGADQAPAAPRSAGRGSFRGSAAAHVLATALATALAAGASSGCAHPDATQEARSLVRRGRNEEAIALLRKRLHEVPGDLAARRALVRVLAADGNLPEADRELVVLAAALPPDDPTALLEHGHALELSHRFEEALAAYDQAAVLSPSPAGPREGGLRAARWGDASEAKPRLEEAVRRGANDGETWHALGLTRLRLGDTAGAGEAYARGFAAAPESLENVLGLASVAVVRGDARSALAAYGLLASRRPRYAGAQLGRAWALVRLGRRPEAAEAIERAQALGADPAHLARARAALAGRTEDPHGVETPAESPADDAPAPDD